MTARSFVNPCLDKQFVSARPERTSDGKADPARFIYPDLYV